MSNAVANNGSQMARALFPDCPYMSKLGKAAATICARNKITNRDELKVWLSDNENVKAVLNTKNCGHGTLRELFNAIGLPSPFDQPKPSKADNVGGTHTHKLADLTERVDTLTESLTELQNRHDMLLAQFNALLTRLPEPGTTGPVQS